MIRLGLPAFKDHHFQQGYEALQQFGTFAPTGVSRLILGLAKMGFGRGRLKLRFSQLLNRINGDKPVDLIYHNLKLRLQPRQNTIESKIMFSAKQRDGAG